MNHTYRSVWNELTRTFVAVAENVRRRSKKSGSSKAAARPAGNRLGFMALEPRLLFDGAAAVDAAQAVVDADAPDLTPAAAQNDGKKEVAFVDTSIADYQTLVAGMRDGVEIVEIGAGQSGLAQMALWAQTHSGYDAIHILSHGREAGFRLGADLLSNTTLGNTATQAQLAGIGQALTADGDLLLYGCNIAAGADGAQFIANLSAATGADVAASDDATGAAAKGGDWVLESQTGAITATLVLLPEVAYDYSEILVNGTTLTFEAGNYSAFSGTSSTSVSYTDNATSSTFTITAKANDGTTAGVIETASTYGTAALYNESEALYFVSNGTGQTTSITVTIGGGKTFDLTSFVFSDENGSGTQNFNVTTSGGGGAYAFAVNAGSTPKVTVTPSGGLDLTGITWFKVEAATAGDVAFLYLDDIALDNVSAASAAPTLTGLTGTTPTYTEDGTAVTVFSGTSAAQTNDSGQTFTGATFTVTNAADSTEYLTINGVDVALNTGTSGLSLSTINGHSAGSVTVTGNATSYTVTITGAALENADMNALLQGITYRDTSQAPSTGSSRVVTLTQLADSGSSNNTVSPNIQSTISLNSVADVSSVTIANGTRVGNTTYRAGDTVNVTVNFDQSVTVAGGTPTLALDIGGQARTASYASGSPGTALLFTYTIQANETDANGIDVSAGSITLNGATIQDTSGTADDATRTYSLVNNTNAKVDGVAPTISNVTATTANGTYKVGDTVDVTVTFSEAVTVNTGGGTPTLTLETGGTDRVVNYSSGSGTTTLTFQYTVQAGDTTGDLDYITTSALALNGGAIQDAAGNNATLTLATPGAAGSLGANKDLVVDGVAPTVTNVTATTANGTYKVGDTVDVTVTFSEAVTVNTGGGTPTLTLETGGTDRVVNYSSGSGTTTLTFQYTVQAGDTNADLDYTGVGALALNGGTIRDAAGNNATLTLATPGAAGSLGTNKDLVVDGVAPTVTNVTATTANGAYKVGDTVDVTVTFSEAVTVNTGGGTPTLTLETGGTDRVVNYSSGSGGTTLTFQYTVQAGDTNADLDYTGVGALALNGGTIRDAAGNNATLTLAAPGAAGSLGANKAIVIDTAAPTVTNVTATTANGTYKVGDTVDVTVTFSEAVTVNTGGGTPTLTLETGGTDRVVNYSSGSGTTTLTFQYTVEAGDTTGDLDYITTSALALNGGAIQDAAGNNATLTLATPGAAGSLGANKDLVVDGVAPTVTNVTATTANGTYKVGDTVDVTVTFSEAVTVNTGGGTPLPDSGDRRHRPGGQLFQRQRHHHPDLPVHGAGR